MIAQITLGTRGSELARAQSLLVEKALRMVHPKLGIETKTIVTRGDKTKVSDPHAGRKGLFTAEIERALLAGEVDVAVHSAKDLPSEASKDTEIVAVLPRAPTDDVLVSKRAIGLASLPHGAVVATGSARRKHQLRWKRGDLNLIDLRGNVPTRLRKLAHSNWDAIVLARAGLERLGFSPMETDINFEGRQLFLEILPRDVFLPAGGQGIIALQIRADDKSTRDILKRVNDHRTLLCVQAEREFLRQLHGDCNSPVGVLATINRGKIKIRAQFFQGESPAPREAQVEGDEEKGTTLACELLRKIEQQHE